MTPGWLDGVLFLVHSQVPSLCPYMVDGVNKFSRAFLKKALIPFMRILPAKGLLTDTIIFEG